MDEWSKKRILEFHPKFRDELDKLYTIANNKLGKGLRLRFSYV